MATLASTQVTAGELGQPTPIAGGLLFEVWRVAGGATGDTAAITPARARFVLGAIPGHACTSGVSTNGTDTNVTLTLTASVATTATFDVLLLLRA